MSVPYRYRKADRIKLGDGILLEDKSVLVVDHIERDEADPQRIIFVDQWGDKAILLKRDDTAKILKKKIPQDMGNLRMIDPDTNL